MIQTSNLCQRTLAEFNMATIKAPPYSPDLNPISMGNLKNFKFLRKFRSRSLTEERIAIFAAKLTRDKCNRYINNLRKVLYWNSY